MLQVLIFLFFVTFGVGGALPKFGGRIVGGDQVTIEEYPYQVSVIYRDVTHTCGGFILDELTIVSAAHCIGFRDHNFFAIRAGSSNKKSGGQLINVSSIVVHENYNDDTFNNDIALFKLEKRLKFNEAVQAIKLPEPWSDVYEGQVGIVAGWGTLSYRGSSPDYLQRVVVPIISRETCDNAYRTVGGVTRYQVCAGKEGKDACQGDSGGALVVDNIAVGIVSNGNECALADFPTIYTRISTFLDWIDRNK